MCEEFKGRGNGMLREKMGEVEVGCKGGGVGVYMEKVKVSEMLGSGLGKMVEKE